MSDLSAAIAQGRQIIVNLQNLDDAAGGNVALEAKIQDANTALGTLELAEMQVDQAKIDALNQQLDTVSRSANAALTDLAKIGTVINDLAGMVGIIQGIAGLV